EVGPRDGFQFEEQQIPTEMKLSLIEKLIAAGLRRIQITSFVHPRLVPQMSDAERLVEKLGSQDDIILSGLVLNMKGLERAKAARMTYVDVSIATNERHSRDNANMSVEQAMAEGEEMVRLALEAGMRPQIGFQTVFGYGEPGDTPLAEVVAAVDRYSGLDIDSVSLADTTGLANPLLIERTLAAIGEVVPLDRIVLHLHDTRGLGMANVVAALQRGISRFDTSFGGLGGCPFIPGATGNIATEDTVYLLHSLGIRTGVNLDEVANCSREMEDFLGRRLPGRMHSLSGTSPAAGG
ncbi:MAG: hydroxymethylglutaryl-CoA lyase, partial [Rhodothermales bacterium]|nr:hydroxymethylglutaryl-CoA lyase [Rhodothermales bacterium]